MRQQRLELRRHDGLDRPSPYQKRSPQLQTTTFCPAKPLRNLNEMIFEVVGSLRDQ
jgi:hypothetical protein